MQDILENQDALQQKLSLGCYVVACTIYNHSWAFTHTTDHIKYNISDIIFSEDNNKECGRVIELTEFGKKIWNIFILIQ